jgi:hypothetical protein
MASRAIEVRSCDRCGSEAAQTWVIIGPDGLPREIELCSVHGAPVANAYALARPSSARLTSPRPAKRRIAPPVETAPEPTPAPVPEPIWR